MSIESRVVPGNSFTIARSLRTIALINDDFPILARAVLQPGGMIYLRTDDQSYFEQMIETFAAAPEFRQVDTPADLAAILTDFEKDFQARGVSTLSAAFQAAIPTQ